MTVVEKFGLLFMMTAIFLPDSDPVWINQAMWYFGIFLFFLGGKRNRD